MEVYDFDNLDTLLEITDGLPLTLSFILVGSTLTDSGSTVSVLLFKSTPMRSLFSEVITITITKSHLKCLILYMVAIWLFSR